ncbi:hypothetical protein LEN26_002291 [Aphanomyces euteiches]|nr:hypothetical protein LEN26_002291 [Aphanomyces euteiches]
MRFVQFFKDCIENGHLDSARHIFRNAIVHNYSADKREDSLKKDLWTYCVQHFEVVQIREVCHEKACSSFDQAPQNKAQEFAAKILAKIKLWDNVIFSDEQKFNLDGPDGFRCYWQDLCCEEETFSKRVCGGGSVMVWAAVNHHVKSSFVVLEGKQASRKYCDTIQEDLMTFIDEVKR